MNTKKKLKFVHQHWWFKWRNIHQYCPKMHKSKFRYSSSSSVICQTTGPKHLPKRFLHIVRSRAFSFHWQDPLLSLRSSSLLPRLLVTSICPSMFPSIACCRRQFLRKMWPIQLAFRFLISCRIFLCSSTLINTLNKIQLDATVCILIYFTAKSFYIFRVSPHPSSGVLKTVTAASGTGYNIGTATSVQRGQIGTIPIWSRWREVALPILWPVPEAAVTVFSTPDDGFGDTRNM